MNYAIFDVETTGLSAHDEVIQFACFLVDENFAITRNINFYCYTQHPMSAGALKTHGITKEMLYKLSGGRTFEDNLDKLECLLSLKDLIWIDYSSSYFDSRLVNQTLTNNGLPPINFGTPVKTLDVESGIHKFSIMHAIANNFFSGRNRRLTQAASVLPFDEDTVDGLYKKWFFLRDNESSSGVPDTLWHNAEYDAFVTYLLLYYNHERFMM